MSPFTANCAHIIFGYMTMLYFIAQYKKNNSIADQGWAAGFLLVALYTLISYKQYLPRQILVTTLIFIWAIRLTLYTTIRNWNKDEDTRYKKWRKTWGSYQPILSFFLIFMLQGILILVISYEVIFINKTNDLPHLTLLDLLGTLMWTFGFMYEIVADIQLYNFLKNNSNQGKILQSGLWAYSRHPNYFGEVLTWWGIFIIALQLPSGFIFIVSPLTITLLVVFVSGIPLAEKELEKNKGFLEYKKTTNSFIPWFKKINHFF